MAESARPASARPRLVFKGGRSGNLSKYPLLCIQASVCDDTITDPGVSAPYNQHKSALALEKRECCRADFYERKRYSFVDRVCDQMRPGATSHWGLDTTSLNFSTHIVYRLSGLGHVHLHRSPLTRSSSCAAAVAVGISVCIAVRVVA